jgi:hypothetical protein
MVAEPPTDGTARRHRQRSLTCAGAGCQAAVDGRRWGAGRGGSTCRPVRSSATGGRLTQRWSRRSSVASTTTTTHRRRRRSPCSRTPQGSRRSSRRYRPRTRTRSSKRSRRHSAPKLVERWRRPSPRAWNEPRRPTRPALRRRQNRQDRGGSRAHPGAGQADRTSAQSRVGDREPRPPTPDRSHGRKPGRCRKRGQRADPQARGPACEGRDQPQRNLRIAAGLTLVVLGLTVGVVPSLALVSGKWAVAGVAVAGAAIVLIGVRLVAASKVGGEFWLWITALCGVATVAASVAASITH